MGTYTRAQERTPGGPQRTHRRMHALRDTRHRHRHIAPPRPAPPCPAWQPQDQSPHPPQLSLGTRRIPSPSISLPALTPIPHIGPLNKEAPDSLSSFPRILPLTPAPCPWPHLSSRLHRSRILLAHPSLRPYRKLASHICSMLSMGQALCPSTCCLEGTQPPPPNAHQLPPLPHSPQCPALLQSLYSRTVAPTLPSLPALEGWPGAVGTAQLCVQAESALPLSSCTISHR